MQEEVQNFEPDSEVENTMKRAKFEKETNLFHHMRALCNYKNGLLSKKLSHTSVVELACQFSRVTSQMDEMSSKVVYNATSLIPSGHPW